MKTLSYGGGVQSTALLVLAAQGKIDYTVALFANVGDDSENPATLAYVEQHAKPYAVANGIVLHELRRTWRDGHQTTLYQSVTSDHATIRIPVYMASGAPGRRACTDEWKRQVIARWHKQNGATPDDPAVCGLGISWDEMQRMREDSNIAWQTLEYPLINLRLTRQDCRNIIAAAGLPVPPKSSCWFCPFHRRSEWQDMKRTQPELFERAVALEQRINEKRTAMGKDTVFLHTSCKPIGLAVSDQMALFEDAACDSGYCFV